MKKLLIIAMICAVNALFAQNHNHTHTNTHTHTHETHKHEAHEHNHEGHEHNHEGHNHEGHDHEHAHAHANVHKYEAPTSQVGKAAQKWANDLFKSFGIKLQLHPSTNFMELQHQYLENQELWDKVLASLKNVDKKLGKYELGKKDIDGARANINITEYTPKNPDNVRLEGHENFIDIQISTGDVMWGVCNVAEHDKTTLAEYVPARDVAFYKSPKTVYFEQKASKPYIFIFFPADLHIPSYGIEGVDYSKKLKKLVVKIENHICAH